MTDSEEKVCFVHDLEKTREDRCDVAMSARLHRGTGADLAPARQAPRRFPPARPDGVGLQVRPEE